MWLQIPSLSDILFIFFFLCCVASHARNVCSHPGFILGSRFMGLVSSGCFSSEEREEERECERPGYVGYRVPAISQAAHG